MLTALWPPVSFTAVSFVEAANNQAAADFASVTCPLCDSFDGCRERVCFALKFESPLSVLSTSLCFARPPR